MHRIQGPAQMFSNSIHSSIQISNQHTWGCPVFVLTQPDQSGKVSKWEPRARVGIYLGHSPSHAGSVALVLNPRTLFVSPQYRLI